MQVYDSLQLRQSENAMKVVAYLSVQDPEVFGGLHDWRFEQGRIDTQANGYDCGFFVAAAIWCILFVEEPVCQEDIPLVRQWVGSLALQSACWEATGGVVTL